MATVHWRIREMGVSRTRRLFVRQSTALTCPFNNYPVTLGNVQVRCGKKVVEVLSKCHVRHSRLLPLLTRLENSLTLTREIHGIHAYT